MRKLGLIAVAALVATALPAAAQEPLPPTPPCETSTQYGAVGLAGKTQAVTPAARPSFGHDIREVPYDEASVTRFLYRIDLSGSQTKPRAQYGDVQIRLTWDNRSDFDLYAYDKDGAELDTSVSFNIQSGVGSETVDLIDLAHCTDVRIDVVNYLGLPNSALNLQTSILGLREEI
jgi:hypothetical protein